MSAKSFKPYHINATESDLAGNDGIGRYLLLPGSDGRAQEISKHFDNIDVKKHPRGHHLYTGTLSCEGKEIDVATIATGMGCASMEIILHELFHLGAKRFLRIGTAGSLQPFVHLDDVVNVQASVRDENTSTHYAPIEVPAVASLEFASSVLLAAEKLGLSHQMHTGIVHCKSALYARELGEGPRGAENLAYMDTIIKNGVLASEMETSALFIQSQIYNYQLIQQGNSPQHRVLAGAILAIITTLESGFETMTKGHGLAKDKINLALESIKMLAMQELM